MDTFDMQDLIVSLLSQHDFFSDSAAITIQKISLPLEVIGFTLTYFEVMRPKQVDAFENSIDNIALKLNEKLIKNRNYLKNEIRPGLPYLVLFLVGGIFYYFVFKQVYHKTTNLFQVAIMIFVLIALVFNTITLYGLVILLSLPLILFFHAILGMIRIVIQSLNGMTGGRATGAIGLILAGLGVMGEIYQVVTIYWGSSTIR